MTKNPLDITERASDILRALNKGVLVTAKAGDKINSMVIEWGTLGFNWGKPVFVCYVRQSRFTRELLDSNPEFTINMPVGDYDKRIIRVCGGKSGRDIDKVMRNHDTDKDNHIIYFGEIVDAYVVEDK